MIEMSQMGQGNVPYNVAKRSVLGPIKRERRMGMGDGFGQTSASFDFGKGELVTVSSCCVMGSQAEDAVMYAFRQAENEMRGSRRGTDGSTSHVSVSFGGRGNSGGGMGKRSGWSLPGERLLCIWHSGSRIPGRSCLPFVC